MKLFGGSKQKSSSTSDNQAFGFIRDTYSPMTQTGIGATNAIAGLLGVGGDPAAAQRGFQNYLGSTGYQFQLGQGMDAITGNMAQKGLLNSGSALKASQQYGQGLASNYFNQYLQQLGGLSTQGLGAGQLIAGAGQRSQSTSKGESSEGAAGFIGGLAGAFFSDVRLKDNIEHVATDERGLKYYEWDWNATAKRAFGLEGRGFGMLAQELLHTQFRDVIDTYGGYFTVHYGDLPEPQTLTEIA